MHCGKLETFLITWSFPLIFAHCMGNYCAKKLPESAIMSSKYLHHKCRGGVYPSSDVRRVPVTDQHVPWNVSVPDYNPPDYNDKKLSSPKPAWADPDISDPSFKPSFNAVDHKIDRRSFAGTYQIEKGRPLNPMGRTGIAGRGLLGRWGPNHAADPIVTRWKRGHDGSIAKDDHTNKQILQSVFILRKDCGEWAIPGGMVDPGESVSQTLKREFGEEALNSIESSLEKKESLEKSISKLFEKGDEIYKGYVDDPRNTDNSWMETVAVNFHDDKGDSVGKIELNAGDDAVGVQWKDVSGDLNLYASHQDFIEKVAHLRRAHW